MYRNVLLDLLGTPSSKLEFDRYYNEHRLQSRALLDSQQMQSSAMPQHHSTDYQSHHNYNNLKLHTTLLGFALYLSETPVSRL